MDHTQHGWEEKASNPKGDFNSLPNLLQTDKDFNVKNDYIMTDVEFANAVGVRNNNVKLINSTTNPTYYVTLTDYVVLVDSSANTYSIALPSIKVAGIGKRFIIKDVGAQTVTQPILVGSLVDNVEFVASWTINTPLSGIAVISTILGWVIESSLMAPVGGIYLPTVTPVSNVDAANPYNCQYFGSMFGFITVTGMIDIQASLPGDSVVWMSLPFINGFTPGFSAPEQCAGVGACQNPNESFAIISNAGEGGADDSASIHLFATTAASNNTYSFTLSYSPFN